MATKRLRRLPPLKISPMSSASNEQATTEQQNHHSTLSDIENEDFTFDCVIVHTEELTETDPTMQPVTVLDKVIEDLPVRPSYSASEKELIREKFEEKLRTKYHLIIRKEVQSEIIHKCSTSGCCCRKQITKHTTYVKIYAPFHVLLFVAEKVRMKLPIEESVGKPVNVSTQTDASDRWNRFIQWIKDLFKDKLSLEIYQPFYLTSVYSLAKIDQFWKFFNKRNLSIDEIKDSSDDNLLNIAAKKYFTQDERHWLIYELLSRVSGVIPVKSSTKLSKPFKYYGVHQLISKGIYNSYYPLHENIKDKSTDRYKLRYHWASVCCSLTPQPLNLIRSYMGEKVSFYFAALGAYTTALIIPAIIGLIIFIYGVAAVNTDDPTSDICGTFGQSTYMCPLCDKTCSFWKLSDSCTYARISFIFDNIATVVFAIIMAIWARGFVEWWKRYQSKLQYNWDSIDFDEFNEPIRPDFEKETTTKRFNPKTQRMEPYVDKRIRFKKIVISISVILIMIVIVCGTIFATIVYRVQMTYILKNSYASAASSIIITITSAVINLIISIILSKFYYWLAQKLTEQELHKYQTEYESAFSIKIYVFEFINFYSSLFYIAFFKGRTNGYPSTYGAQSTSDFNEQCDPAGCMVELSIQLLIIMLGKQLIGNTLEYGGLLLSATNPCRKRLSKTSAQWIIDKELKEFDWQMLLPEYLEIMMQFGFVTLFVAAFPLAPLLALLNNIFELRFDAWKLLTRYRRPTLCKAADIGVWTDIFSAISYLAVLINAAVIAWTSEFIPRLTYQITENPSKTLDNYINWTLSAFPIDDYNRTGTMNPQVPANLTYCRYRDFRESTGPNYIHTTLFWHIIAARLAFMLLFENVVFLIVYLVQLVIPDVPSEVQEAIDHQRYAEQRHQPAPPSNLAVVKRVLEEVQTNMQVSDKIQVENNTAKNCCDQETNTES